MENAVHYSITEQNVAECTVKLAGESFQIISLPFLLHIFVALPDFVCAYVVARSSCSASVLLTDEGAVVP